MNEITINQPMALQQNKQIEQTFKKERGRLLDFIKSRISNPEEAEDILQDVFYQLIETYRLMKPIERMTGWLFTVARNKITDRYRKKKPQPMSSLKANRNNNHEEEALSLADILPDLGNDPDTEYLREMIWAELGEALDLMPAKQREIFVLHEFEGKSFKEMAAITGDPVNTLLSRKRYAILFLRERLHDLYEELFN